MDRYYDTPRVRFDVGTMPVETMAHILARDTGGLRTICGLGAKAVIWRVSRDGAKKATFGAGWSMCATCCRRTARGELP